MEEACRIAHAKLISGTCPWCGKVIENGNAVDLTGSLSHIIDSPKLRLDVIPIRTIVRSRGPLEPKIAITFTLGVAKQLEAYFSISPHRNISPDTLYVGAADQIYLGPCSAIDDDILHVADCLAPEAALNSYTTDQRTDIYSLGCSLYFMLTGRPPFQGSSISEVLLKHQVETPLSARELNPKIPEALANICVKMMAKKPIDRYQSLQELQAALAICLYE